MSFNVYDYDWTCDNCGAYLNTQYGFGTTGDYWLCEKCGYVNDVTINNTDDAPDDDYYPEQSDSDDDIPEGCAACGGPYPLCKDGCAAFDDED